MIFRPELAEKILRGEKTVTRRPAKFKQVNEGTRNEHSVWEPPPYKPGKTYAVQPGRGKKGIGRIKVLRVYHQPLCMMRDHDFRREGFQGTEDFAQTWRDIYGRGNWLDQVNVIEFELASGAARGGS